MLKELREFGLRYPGSHTKSPWPGHLDLAVKDKTFAYLSIEGQPFTISCKLPHSSEAALMLPFTQPTGYGLGKSGWVSASFEDGTPPPVPLLKDWIDESYRAQAPRKLVATLDAASAAPAATSPARKPPAAKLRAAPTKTASARPVAKPAAKRTGPAKPAKQPGVKPGTKRKLAARRG